MPDQMILQIHESIGHPLELDRILGDERNFAGTSFIRQEDFGHYPYGSPMLNVTFDPTLPGELASYSHDDDGSPAQREYLIRDGILQRPLGGALFDGRSRGPRGEIVGHCLLIETDAHGLVLVDTGFGLKDVADRKSVV